MDGCLFSLKVTRTFLYYITNNNNICAYHKEVNINKDIYFRNISFSCVFSEGTGRRVGMDEAACFLNWVKLVGLELKSF
jgi:hypothetical protein